jgi:hypothetical protein
VHIILYIRTFVYVSEGMSHSSSFFPSGQKNVFRPFHLSPREHPPTSSLGNYDYSLSQGALSSSSSNSASPFSPLNFPIAAQNMNKDSKFVQWMDKQKFPPSSAANLQERNATTSPDLFNTLNSENVYTLPRSNPFPFSWTSTSPPPSSSPTSFFANSISQKQVSHRRCPPQNTSSSLQFSSGVPSQSSQQSTPTQRYSSDHSCPSMHSDEDQAAPHKDLFQVAITTTSPVLERVPEMTLLSFLNSHKWINPATKKGRSRSGDTKAISSSKSDCTHTARPGAYCIDNEGDLRLLYKKMEENMQSSSSREKTTGILMLLHEQCRRGVGILAADIDLKMGLSEKRGPDGSYTIQLNRAGEPFLMAHTRPSQSAIHKENIFVVLASKVVRTIYQHWRQGCDNEGHRAYVFLNTRRDAPDSSPLERPGLHIYFPDLLWPAEVRQAALVSLGKVLLCNEELKYTDLFGRTHTLHIPQELAPEIFDSAITSLRLPYCQRYRQCSSCDQSNPSAALCCAECKGSPKKVLCPYTYEPAFVLDATGRWDDQTTRDFTMTWSPAQVLQRVSLRLPWNPLQVPWQLSDTVGGRSSSLVKSRSSLSTVFETCFLDLKHGPVQKFVKLFCRELEKQHSGRSLPPYWKIRRDDTGSPLVRSVEYTLNKKTLLPLSLTVHVSFSSPHPLCQTRVLQNLRAGAHKHKPDYHTKSHVCFTIHLCNPKVVVQTCTNFACMALRKEYKGVLDGSRKVSDTERQVVRFAHLSRPLLESAVHHLAEFISSRAGGSIERLRNMMTSPQSQRLSSAISSSLQVQEAEKLHVYHQALTTKRSMSAASYISQRHPEHSSDSTEYERQVVERMYQNLSTSSPAVNPPLCLRRASFSSPSHTQLGLRQSAEVDKSVPSREHSSSVGSASKHQCNTMESTTSLDEKCNLDTIYFSPASMTDIPVHVRCKDYSIGCSNAHSNSATAGRGEKYNSRATFTPPSRPYMKVLSPIPLPPSSSFIKYLHPDMIAEETQ